MAREGSENEQKMDDDDVKCELYLLRLMNVLEHVLKVVHAIGWMWRQLHSTGQYSTPLDAQHTISSTTGGRCLAWRGRQEAEGVQAGGRGCAGRRQRVCRQEAQGVHMFWACGRVHKRALGRRVPGIASLHQETQGTPPPPPPPGPSKISARQLLIYTNADTGGD